MEAGEGSSYDLALPGPVESSSDRCPFLELPGEILSQIASYLPITQLIPFLSLHPVTLGLTRSHLSPLPAAIREALRTGPPYPHLLSVLPSLRSFLPGADDGRFFLDILTRARPRWILERLEMGHWTESTWQEAYERRFLPGWKQFKKEDDTWRAVFLRMLCRLEHRNLGCTHEESWTRFVTIHRNGSAGINRFYSRLFDPYEIYDELKSQNNFASHPTQVRVVVHLQDVRILALGVLSSEPTLFVNRNAHLLLHPPLLHSPPSQLPIATSPPTVIPGTPHHQAQRSPPLAAVNGSANSNEVYFPLVRTLSPSTPGTTTYGLGEGAMSRQSSTNAVAAPSSPSLTSTLASILPGRRRRHTATDEHPGGALVQVRSRDSDDGRRRSWAATFSLTRSGSTGNTLERAISAGVPGLPSPALPVVGEHEQVDNPSVEPVNQLDQAVAQDEDEVNGSATPLKPSRPYSVIRHPLPAPAYDLYPNFTPSPSTGEGRMVDTRALHPEIEDDYTGRLWAHDDAAPPSARHEEPRMVEWSEERNRRERWVGPMILVAQLHPATRHLPYPQSVTAGPTEGPNPDLGPKGMYASLGFEDVKALLPWVEFKGGGAYHAEPMRSGLGYE